MLFLEESNVIYVSRVLQSNETIVRSSMIEFTKVYDAEYYTEWQYLEDMNKAFISKWQNGSIDPPKKIRKTFRNLVGRSAATLDSSYESLDASSMTAKKTLRMSK
jgi:hypothetical protein